MQGLSEVDGLMILGVALVVVVFISAVRGFCSRAANEWLFRQQEMLDAQNHLLRSAAHRAAAEQLAALDSNALVARRAA